MVFISTNTEVSTQKEGAVRQSPHWYILYPAPKIMAVSFQGPLGMVIIQKYQIIFLGHYLCLIKSVFHDSTQQKSVVVCRQVGCVLDLKREIKFMN